ncbi:Hypothetical protein, putative [Bodo saltans]|uniref:Uncharacterized protein n=1 Tax=Bodo saltans TaxID=75058 RepID=A0A0S4IPV4_BODSA|nr:Hypothetical protein, putative [Bodo saltans]|eukprot:CUF90089.1 Hypothetical protein, putative [Bodo saltans]
MPSAIVGRTTKDGRKRAPQNLFGVHHVRPFPAFRMILAAGVAYYVFKQNYAVTTESPQQKFLRKVKLSPYGVLGTQMNMQGGQSRIAAEPDDNTVVVDPAGLKYIQGVAAGAGGAAGSIYNWLGLRGPFPEAVRRFVTGRWSCPVHTEMYSTSLRRVRPITCVCSPFPAVCLQALCTINYPRLRSRPSVWHLNNCTRMIETIC